MVCIIFFGYRSFGKCDYFKLGDEDTDKYYYIRTQFFHISFLPLCPVKSYIGTDGGNCCIDKVSETLHGSVANPRGRHWRAPPYGSRFFCFDIQIFRNVGASGVGAPTRLAPPTGNPGSVTAGVCTLRNLYIQNLNTAKMHIWWVDLGGGVILPN